MRGKALKILVMLVSLLGTAASVYFILEVSKELKKLPELPVVAKHAPAGGHGEAPPADAHGAPAPAADAHGAPAPAADAHGAPAPAADAHGAAAPAADAHGAPARGLASAAVPLISLDEVFANISTEDQNHTLAVKLELELFDEKFRSLIEKERVQAGIKHTIIQSSREQPFSRLNSLAGKLYYKEYLILRLNEYLHEPVVRDLHFSSFFLQ